MGKGDMKTARGKRSAGSYGKTRKRKKAAKPIIEAKPKKKAAKKPAAAKKTTAKKPAAKKPAAKKAAPAAEEKAAE